MIAKSGIENDIVRKRRTPAAREWKRSLVVDQNAGREQDKIAALENAASPESVMWPDKILSSKHIVDKMHDGFMIRSCRPTSENKRKVVTEPKRGRGYGTAAQSQDRCASFLSVGQVQTQLQLWILLQILKPTQIQIKIFYQEYGNEYSTHVLRNSES